MGMAIVTGTTGNDSLEATSALDTLTGLAGVDTFFGTAFQLAGDTVTDLEGGESIEINPAFIFGSPYDPVTGFSYSGGVLTVDTVDNGTISIFIENAPYGYFVENFADEGQLDFFEAFQVITVSAVQSTVPEDGGAGIAQLVLDPDVANEGDTAISLSISAGSADTGDYTVLNTSVVIPAFSAAPVTVDIASIIDDTELEGAETFTVNLLSPSQAIALTQEEVAFTIAASDQATTGLSISAAAVDRTLREDGTPGTAQIVLTPDSAPDAPVLVDLSVLAGTAGTADYSVLTTQVELPAGSTAPVPFDIASIIDDTLTEGAETFTVSLFTLEPGVSLPQDTIDFQINASDQPAPTVVSFVPQEGDGGGDGSVIKFPWEQGATDDTATFTATFSAPVVNVDPGDIALAFTGTANGRIAAFQQTGETTYDIVVDALSGVGTVGLDVAAGTDIRALAGGAALDPAEPPTDGVVTVNRGEATAAPASIADPFRVVVAEDGTATLDLGGAVTEVAGVPFQAEYYLYANPDVAAAIAAGAVPDAATHFAQFGLAEGRAPNPFFDETWYLSTNPEIAAAVQGGAFPSGLQHYALYGADENRAPGPLFDPAAYLSANPDIAGSGMDALSHFILYGAAEGRDGYLVDA
jgi:hypothetical protein